MIDHATRSAAINLRMMMMMMMASVVQNNDGRGSGFMDSYRNCASFCFKICKNTAAKVRRLLLTHYKITEAWFGLDPDLFLQVCPDRPSDVALSNKHAEKPCLLARSQRAVGTPSLSLFFSGFRGELSLPGSEARPSFTGC